MRKSSSTGAERLRSRSAATAAPTAGTRRMSSCQRKRTPDSGGRAWGGSSPRSPSQFQNGLRARIACGPRFAL